MKIAYIVSSLKECGPVLVVKSLTDELVKNNISVSVFYFDEIPGVIFNCPTQKISFLDYKIFKGFNIVHSHGIRPDLFIFLHKNKIGAKTVSTIHSYIQADLSYQKGKVLGKIFTYVWNIILMRHHKILLLSQHMKNHYSPFLINKKLDYVYNSVSIKDSSKINLDEAIEQKLMDARKEYTILGSISNLSKLKGLNQIIQLLSFEKSLAYIIIGDGDNKQNLVDLATKLNVIDRCYFIGHHQNPYAWLQYVDVFVMPSYTEGFPLSVLEAGWYKKPILCSALPIYAELFTAQEIQTFVNNNIESLKNGLLKILKNKDTFGENIYQKISNNYTSNIAMRNHLKIYESLIK